MGKTIVSAALVHALKADYWKPIQAGGLDHTDSDVISELAGNRIGKIHPETFLLNTPASPHFAANIDGVSISLGAFKIPETENDLIIEGAGGLLVPLNENDTVLDLIRTLRTPLILVCRNYLGSINHTLLSVLAAKQAGVAVHGLIFFGERNDETERIILKKTGLNRLGGIYSSGMLDADSIMGVSDQFEDI